MYFTYPLYSYPIPYEHVLTKTNNMFIKINLTTKKKYSRKFPVNLKDLEEAIKTCYLGLGTPYQPIAVDNFVSLGESQFPAIPPKAKITVKLCPEDEEDCHYKLSDPKLVCCIVKNVDRKFNDKDKIAKGYWKKIFDCNSKHIFSAPEGTLFISPNKKGKCSISTKEKFTDTIVAYSIMFSLIIEHEDKYRRRYYFILDPVVKIRSRD